MARKASLRLILGPNFSGAIRRNVPLSSLTSWRIGGPADWLITPDNHESLYAALKQFKELNLRYLILGKGTNILFSDDGFRGIIVKLGSGFERIETENVSIKAGGAVSMTAIGEAAVQAGLTGFEALAGIPGTAGAAAAMNAGAHGISMLDRVTELMLVGNTGLPARISHIESKYRHHHFEPGSIITDLKITLKTSDRTEVEKLTHRFRALRTSTQPLNQPSAGCTFKNPEGTGAGRLIDQLGLKGHRIGDAAVSSMHANFLINLGKATAQDMIRLIQHIHARIFQEFGVRLELEVIVLDSQGRLISLPEVTT